MLRILINLPIKRLVRTGPDWSLTGPGILEMAKDRRPDCGCGPVQSCDFRSWLVRVRSSPGLFPVLGPDFQTLIATFLNLSSLLEGLGDPILAPQPLSMVLFSV